MGQEQPDPADDVSSKSKCLEGVVDEDVADGVKGLLEVDEEDQRRLLLGDSGAHEVDDVDDAASNVLLGGLGFLLISNDVFDGWFYSVGDAGTCKLVKY